MITQYEKLQFVCSIFTKKSSAQIHKMLAKKDATFTQVIFVRHLNSSLLRSFMYHAMFCLADQLISPQLPLAFYHEIHLWSCCFLPRSSLCFLLETVVQMNPTVLDWKQPIFIFISRL